MDEWVFICFCNDVDETRETSASISIDISIFFRFLVSIFIFCFCYLLEPGDIRVVVIYNNWMGGRKDEVGKLRRGLGRVFSFGFGLLCMVSGVVGGGGCWWWELWEKYEKYMRLMDICIAIEGIL